ncbi:hypothetical protein [Rhizobium azibense]|uniref:Transmembrane anchored protein n=1 Tax=Rhizobium azibense TaxID=1136135 RepID=A0A4R3RHP5_9HYPH|nr:hypothetical protein [Rhizobium azibense]TCU34194.1 hypothetical protein EV129_113179 [Rhizobium azibense]
MSHLARRTGISDESPLFSNGFILRVTAVVAVLAMLTLAISIGGRWIGRHITLAGNTDNTATVTITIGRDTLNLPENVIRFPNQRRSGVSERADVYLTWPQLQGYTKEHRERFDDVSQSADLIFLQITQSTMSRDMSGRVELIYKHVMEGAAVPYGSGLTLHKLKAEAGYGGEVLLTAPRANEATYAVRCILPSLTVSQTSGDCQRDIKAGKDLSVLYRFSSRHLRDWDHIDAAIRRFVEARIVTRSATPR